LKIKYGGGGEDSNFPCCAILPIEDTQAYSGGDKY